MGSVLQHRKIDWMLMNQYLGRNRVCELNEYIRKEERPQVNLNFFLQESRRASKTPNKQNKRNNRLKQQQ